MAHEGVCVDDAVCGDDRAYGGDQACGDDQVHEDDLARLGGLARVEGQACMGGQDDEEARVRLDYGVYGDGDDVPSHNDARSSSARTTQRTYCIPRSRRNRKKPVRTHRGWW